MASEVDICNLALGHIRAGTINSLDEQSVQARQCKTLYPLLRDQMLQDSPWQFAGSIKPLVLLVQDTFNWAYTYQYPSDCLRVNRVMPNYEAINADNRTSGLYYTHRAGGIVGPLPDALIEYKVILASNNRTIGCNYSDVYIDYRARVENPSLFSLNFIMALSHLMAAELAVPIAGVEAGRGLRSDSMSMYKGYLSAGIANELNEQKKEIADSEYITIRN